MSDQPPGPPSLASFVPGSTSGNGGGNGGNGGGGRSFDRVPPHSLEAEVSVLGAALLSRNAATEVAETLKPDDFYRSAHGVVFEAIQRLMAQGDAVDAVTVLDWLSRNGRLDEVGGATAIHELTAAVPTAANAAHYARIVHEKALLRRLIEAATSAARMGYESADDARTVIDQAEALIYQVGETGTRSDYSQLKDLLNSSFEAIEKLAENRSEVTGLATGFNDLDRLTAGLQPQNLIIIAARPAMGKCVTERSRVITASDGTLRSIGELVRRGEAGKPADVVSLEGAGRLTRRGVAEFHANGVKTTFTLRTRLGRSTAATSNHPFLTPDGWVELRDLAAGDLIAVPRVLEVFGSDPMLESEVKLLGYLIGDGGLTNSTPVLTTASFAIQEEAARCAGAFGVKAVVRERWLERANALAFVGGHLRDDATLPRQNYLTARLRELGLWGLGSHDKFVPEPIFRAPRDQVALFLSRLFATDGSAWVAEGYGYFGISYCSVSERLIRDVQHLLLRFGIIARVREKQVKYLPDGPDGEETRRLAYELEIRDAENVLRFLDEIGIFSKEAACDRVRAAAEARNQRHTNTDLLPIEIWDLILAEKGERSWADVSEATGRPRNHNWHVGKRRPSRRLVAELAEALDSQRLRDWAHSDIYWDEIVSIEEYGEEPVYDLTIPELHNFVADDLIVHNSSLSLNLAQYVTVELTRPTIVFSLEMSKIEIVNRLLASEARIDSHRIKTGRLEDADWRKLGDALGRLSEAPLFIDDTPSISLMEIRSKCRRLKQRHGLDLIIVDYLQLMQSHRRVDSRQQEVAEISRGLKMLAKELDVPVIALSQLSRQPESRTDKRPQLADLRESGCVTGDTRILRADTGATVTIGELARSGERDIPVWTVDDDYRLVRGTMTHAFSSGEKMTYRLRLASGREIKASANHPFLEWDGWSRLDELEVGDQIAVPRSLPAPDVEPMPEPEIVMLAHLIGDGCFVKRQPLHYTNADLENIELVEQAASHWGITPRRVAQKTWWHVYLPAPYRLTHGKRNPICAWLDEMGLYGKRSGEKFLPDRVLRLPDDQLGRFLGHLWATDGHISVGNDKTNRAVNLHYSTKSRRLADDVRLALLRLGIRARISTVSKKGYSDSYHVWVNGVAQIRRFVEQVPLVGVKADVVPQVLETIDGIEPRAPWSESFPAEVWESVLGGTEVEMSAAVDLASRLAPSHARPVGILDRPIPRDRLLDAARLVDDPALLRLAQSDLDFDRVVAIEPLGVEEVFDATVDETHNFVADCIIIHNSIEQDADIVGFIYRDEVYDEDSPDRGIAELIISKHRNGATGTVKLAFLNHLTKFANLARGTGQGRPTPGPPTAPPPGGSDTHTPV